MVDTTDMPPMGDAPFADDIPDISSFRRRTPPPAQPPPPRPAPEAPKTPPTVAEILAVAAARPPASVYGTGFLRLDELLEGGLRARDLHVLCAPPGGGKTYLTGQIARALAVVSPVLWIATEIDEETQAARIAALDVPCRPTDLLDRKISPQTGAEATQGLRIHVAELDPYQTADDPLERIWAHVGALRTHYGCAPAIVVDYLQMLATGAADQVRHGVGRAAYILRQAARALDVPILAISSTSRANYGRNKGAFDEETDPRAWLATAKESGDVEFAAAVMLFLETGEADHVGVSPARLVLAKVRRGERGFVGLRFDGPRGRFDPDEQAIEMLGANKRNSDDDSKVYEAVRVRVVPLARTAWKGQIPGIGTARTMAAIDRLVEAGRLAYRDAVVQDAQGRDRATRLLVVAE